MKSIGEIARENASDIVRQKAVAEAVEREQGRRDEMRLERLRSMALVPARFADCTLDSLDRSADNAAALDAAKRVVSVRFSQGLALYGNVGAGKTAIAAAIVNAALDQLIPAVMLTATSMLDQLHEAHSYDSDTSVSEMMRAFAATDVLMIDDLGREAVTSRRYLSWLHELLDRRWAAKRPLIVTSNRSFDELLERYVDICGRAGEPESTAEGIVDRLRGLIPEESWFEVRGPSRRGSA